MHVQMRYSVSLRKVSGVGKHIIFCRVQKAAKTRIRTLSELMQQNIT